MQVIHQIDYLTSLIRIIALMRHFKSIILYKEKMWGEVLKKRIQTLV